MTAFHLRDPLPARLIALIASVVLAVLLVVIGFPLYATVPAVVAGVLVYLTARYPEHYFALQQDRVTQERYAEYNRFIDALVAGSIIDKETTRGELEVLGISPFVFTVEMHQHGKTADMLVRACEQSLNAMGAVDVDVKQESASLYTVRYSAEDPRRILAHMRVPFSELVDDELSITHLPVGRYIDGSVVCMNLESRNFLINGIPRAGKSVLLSCGLSALCRASADAAKYPSGILTYCLSPKILDFQEFEDAVALVSDVAEMLDVLDWISEEVQRRKRYCIEHRIKKVTPEHYGACPPIVCVVDEYTVIKTATGEDENGRIVRLGEKFEERVMRILAESGFAGVSFILCTQRASSTNMRTDLRDLISQRICFATESLDSTRMCLGEYAELAPCHEIEATQKGVGYISVDGQKPAPFKGAFADAQDERSAAVMASKRMMRKNW